jgi:hypothetical protein
VVVGIGHIGQTRLLQQDFALPDQLVEVHGVFLLV